MERHRWVLRVAVAQRGIGLHQSHARPAMRNDLLCEQTGGFEYRGWHVEQYWSQWDHTCINGDLPVSLKRFLQASNHPIGAGLRTLSRSSINVEYIASQFR